MLISDMNNKGFTLIEVMGVIVLISIATFVVMKGISSTLSVGGNEAYLLMKNSVIKAGRNYVMESDAGVINSDFSFDDNNSFKASVLKNYGYFSNFKSPIDGKDVGDCLILTATRENGNILIDLVDNCY